MSKPDPTTLEILRATKQAQKRYAFDKGHDPNRPIDFWFQESEEGPILFVVFYSQACRWSRCVSCNLPSLSSRTHVDYERLMAQVDTLLDHPRVRHRRRGLKKLIVSNNGSILDEATFSSTALIYLIAKLNLELPQLEVLSLETRVEYVDEAELEFLARALREGSIPTVLELAIGFEAFDSRVRNRLFGKGLSLRAFDRLCRLVARYGYHLKCYFMQKPVSGMTDAQAVADIQRAIEYLGAQAHKHQIQINLHLNPTYVARGTLLEKDFQRGGYQPPYLRDVAEAVLHGEGRGVSVFVGLSDEGLACEGGSFRRRGDGPMVKALGAFNRTQDYTALRREMDRLVRGTRE